MYRRDGEAADILRGGVARARSAEQLATPRIRRHQEAGSRSDTDFDESRNEMVIRVARYRLD